jgi:hypothetical protein
VTPITKLELIAGFNLSGAIKAVGSGMVLMIVGSLIVSDPVVPPDDCAPWCGRSMIANVTERSPYPPADRRLPCE